MRDTFSGIRNLVVNDTAFVVVVLLTVATVLGYQIVVASSPEDTWSLLAIFLITALAEFQYGRPR